MKHVFFSAVAISAIMAGSAFAADMPLKAPAYVPPPLYWTGFYAGVNAGYGIGTNNAATDSFTQRGSDFYNDTGGGLFHNFNILGGGETQFGDRATQSGFLGGAQFGYNYQLYPTIIIGFETDFQGSSLRGSGTRTGSAAASSPVFPDQDQVLQTEQFVQSGPVVERIQAGVDSLGTVRARAGYLITPSLLGFVTSGLTYGHAHANINLASSQGATLTGESFIGFNPTTTQTFVGGGSANRELVGWNVGGGFEWMFIPNLSLKAEALYWNLGKLDVTTVAQAGKASFPLGIEGATEQAFLNPALLTGHNSVSFQGVIIRAGLNYHFSYAGL